MERRHTLRLSIVSLALPVCLAMGGVVITQPGVRASGPGPCTVAQQAGALAPAGGVSARLSRTQGVTGTALSVTGGGWPAGAPVTVDAYMTRNGSAYNASANLAQGRAGANGALTLPQFRAPMLDTCSSLSQTADGKPVDGGDVLFLVHTADGRARAPLMFTYLKYLMGPGVMANDVGADVPAGTRITLNGARWEPNERVTVTAMQAPWQPYLGPQQPAWRPIVGDTVSVLADNQGAFSVMMPALDEPAETQIIFFAQGTGPRYGDVNVYSGYFVMLPKDYPTLHLDQRGVIAGASVTVSGERWPANVSGVVEYCRGQSGLPGMAGLRCLGGQHLGDFQTDRSGRFSLTVHLPTNAALGPITIQTRIPSAAFGLIVYAQGQPLSIIPTFAQAHPRLTQLIARAPYLGAAFVLLVALALVSVVATRKAIRDDTRA
ncbi:MAG TPA: hypothetical protein VF812_05070 [Ktedonobacterales bacterium]